MALKDYYQVLGVQSSASADEIKRAYRRLARELHPDATGGDREKEDRFLEVTAAYDLLSDEGRRELYDATRRLPRRVDIPPSGPAPAHKARPGTGRFPSGQPGFDREARSAGKGFGGGGGFGGATTKAPGGSARAVPPGGFRSESFSERSMGRGQVELTLAEALLGTEKVMALELPDGAERDIVLHIAPGTEDGEVMRVPGARLGFRGGDILLNVKVAPDPRFRRAGMDLEVDVPVRVDQAVLGGEVEVPTLTGTARITLPEGTSGGHKIVVAGEGAGDRQGQRGDLRGVVQIIIPKVLSEEAREHMRRFAEALRAPAEES